MKIIRLILLAVSVIAFAWFAVPLSLSVSLNIGNMTGMTVACLIFLYACFMTHIHKSIGLWKKHRALKWVYRGILSMIAGIVLMVVTESACMIHAAGKEPAPSATVVVLGCRVYGERASLSMVERLEAAYDYLVKHEDAVCVLSGGQGNGENITEAECMYRYLIAKGIASERLYKEERSTDTRENLQFSQKLIKEQGLNPVMAIATSEYHEYRAGKIAESFGIEYGAVPGKTAFWLFPTYYVRELYAILYEWIF